MRLRLALWAAGGIVLGAAATLAIGRTAGGGDPPPDAASTTTTEPAPMWFEPQEIVLGPAVIVPESLQVMNSGVRLDFRLEPITPASHGPDDAVDTAVFPDWWTLLTDEGPIAARSAPWTREVLFDVPDGFTADRIRGLRLDSSWLLAPIRAPFTPDADDRSRHDIAPGVTAEVALVQDQSGGALVVVDLAAADPFIADDLAVQGTGAGWRPSTPNVSGTTRWSLLYLRGALPDPIPMEVLGTAWMPRTHSILLDVGAILDG